MNLSAKGSALCYCHYGQGLDFQAVNWVLQINCPKNARTHIHRAGGMAGYRKDGKAVLILLLSKEKQMVQKLLIAYEGNQNQSR